MTGPTITPARLAEIEARAAAATPGPWNFYHRSGGDRPAAGIDERSGLGWEWDEDPPYNAPPEPMRGVLALGADAAFIAHAREDVPALCAALREAWAEIERLQQCGDAL